MEEFNDRTRKIIKIILIVGFIIAGVVSLGFILYINMFAFLAF